MSNEKKLLSPNFNRAYEFFVKQWNADQVERKERKRIAAKKLRFNSGSAAQKRVAIAKDVIAQVNLRKIIPTQGSYLERPNGSASGIDTNVAIQDQLPSQCIACGIGSTFVCALKYDKTENLSRTMVSLSDDRVMRKYLQKFFSKAQIDLIEVAFEHRTVTDDQSELEDAQDKSIRAAIRFGRKYAYHSERLIAIMDNIVMNRGVFVP